MSETVWLDSGWFPFQYAFIPSEEAWMETLKRLEIDPLAHPYPKAKGKCTPFTRVDERTLMILITIRDVYTLLDLVKVVSHESMHVWRELRDLIGEEAPSAEFEAYAVQAISENILKAALKSWRKPDLLEVNPLQSFH